MEMIFRISGFVAGRKLRELERTRRNGFIRKADYEHVKRKLVRRAKVEQRRIALIIAHITQRVCDIITIISALCFILFMGWALFFYNYQPVNTAELIFLLSPLVGVAAGEASERLDPEIKKLERKQ